MLSDLPVERTAAATACFVFARSFAQTWGITIASTILQNELKRKLPAAFTAQFPAGVEIAYAAIPYVGTLEEPLRSEVRAAFADSLSVVWATMAGIGGLGLISVLIMREVPMRGTIDRRYGLEGADAEADVETGSMDMVDMDEKATPRAAQDKHRDSDAWRNTFVGEDTSGMMKEQEQDVPDVPALPGHGLRPLTLTKSGERTPRWSVPGN